MTLHPFPRSTLRVGTKKLAVTVVVPMHTGGLEDAIKALTSCTRAYCFPTMHLGKWDAKAVCTEVVEECTRECEREHKALVRISGDK